MSTYPPLPVPAEGAPQPGNTPPLYPPVVQPPAKPLPYHRLARTYSAYRWWKPLLVGLIAFGLYLGMMLLASMVLVIATFSSPTLGSSLDVSLSALESVDMSDPLIFAFSMISLGLMIPALFWATRIMNFQKVGALTSVRGTMRWGWLGICMAVAGGVLMLNFGISMLLDLADGFPTEVDFSGPNMWTLLLLTILLVPFQAAAEEYVFRGYFMQLVGGWLRHPAFAILLPIPFFVFGHMYDIYGQLDVAMFALVAGWLTWRTGGLEAAIGLHVVNNSVIFAFGAIGLVDVNATEGSLVSLLISVFTTAVFVFVIVKLAERKKIERLSLALVRHPASTPAS